MSRFLNRKQEVFTEDQIIKGSVLGGPLAAGFMIYKNFIYLKEFKKALATVVVVTISFLGILLLIYIKITSAIFVQPLALIVSISIYELFQKKPIALKHTINTLRGSIWEAALIGVIPVIFIMLVYVTFKN